MGNGKSDDPLSPSYNPSITRIEDNNAGVSRVERHERLIVFFNYKYYDIHILATSQLLLKCVVCFRSRGRNLKKMQVEINENNGTDNNNIELVNDVPIMEMDTVEKARLNSVSVW
jgi:hypothetical protein